MARPENADGSGDGGASFRLRDYSGVSCRDVLFTPKHSSLMVIFRQIKLVRSVVDSCFRFHHDTFQHRVGDTSFNKHLRTSDKREC